MKGTTHLACGIACSLYAVPVVATHIQGSGINTPFLYALTVCGAVIGSLLPDIDSPKSKMGRKMPTTSHLINFMVGHRTLFHSLIIPAILAFIVYCFTKLGSVSILALLLLSGITFGYLLHILLDSFTKEGVPLLYPLSNHGFGLKLVHEGGVVDYIIGFIFYVLAALKIFQHMA